MWEIRLLQCQATSRKPINTFEKSLFSASNLSHITSVSDFVLFTEAACVSVCLLNAIHHDPVEGCHDIASNNQF